jgi:alkaline phosphatase
VRAIVSDVLAFDEACGEAFRFAEEDGETLVVVVPDHGNSGISIGSNKHPGYASLTKDELFGGITRLKTSAEVLVKVLRETTPAELKQKFFELTGIELTEMEYAQLLQAADYGLSPLPNEERKGAKLPRVVAKVLDRHSCFGFTSTGHTGEEVFLAVHDPRPGQRLTGFHTNIELNQYMGRAMGLGDGLDSLTNAYFAKHTEVFDGLACTVDASKGEPVLVVRNEGRVMEIRPNTNVIRLDGEDVKLSSVVVYVDKNGTFYLPRMLRGLVEAGRK